MAVSSKMKKPAASNPSTKKRPASSINETINKTKRVAAEADDEEMEHPQEGNGTSDGRDKAKGQKYAKMKDQLPQYVQDLIEVESKKAASPREWKTKCINALFVREDGGKLVLNLKDPLFEEHRKIYNTKYSKEEDHAMPESILKGLYFHNDEKAWAKAVADGDIESVDCGNGKIMWKYTSYKKGTKQGTTQEQNLSGKRTMSKEQEGLLKRAFDGIGWEWSYATPKDVKVFENGGKIPKSILDLVDQAADSQNKLMKEATALIRGWPGGKNHENLQKLKRGHATCATHLQKLTHMKEFNELPDGLEATKSNLDSLMVAMAEDTQAYNELIESTRGLLKSSKN